MKTLKFELDPNSFDSLSEERSSLEAFLQEVMDDEDVPKTPFKIEMEIESCTLYINLPDRVPEQTIFEIGIACGMWCDPDDDDEDDDEDDW